MKTNFTFFGKTTRSWFLFMILLFSLSFESYAQTKHVVEVTDIRFSPRDLEINLGDTVQWINLEGSHNVNGTQITYPGNPVSFGNDIGTEWTYTFVFRDPGLYNYQCDVHVIDGMLGTVTVDESTGTDLLKTGQLQLYPNPASDKVWINLGDQPAGSFSFRLYDLAGKSHQISHQQVNQTMELDINPLRKGIYILEMKLPSAVKTVKLIKN